MTTTTVPAAVEPRYVEQAIAWRRHLHRFPELSFQEEQTRQYIIDELRDLRHAEVVPLTPTSVVLAFRTGRPGARMGLRADIDALAVHEDRPDLDFASQVPGKMHACGHDGHTGVLMAACRWIDEHLDQLSGEVHAIFQHAEELPPGGASEMVATGYFDDFDFIYGQHLMSNLPTGVIDIKDGPASANSDLYHITLYGKGGHASMPEASIDPVAIGAQFINGIQTIVSRRIAARVPAVVSNTVFVAGSTDALNVIPHSARLAGSVRTTDADTRVLVREALRAQLDGLVAAHPGLRYDYDYQIGYDAVCNDPRPTAVVRELARARWGAERVLAQPAMLGGEDFAAFSARVPSTYAIIGSANAAKGCDYPHHHPKFALDEDSFGMALQMMIDVACAGARLARPRPAAGA